jgi:phosphatidate cytidylyltransferase
MAAGSVQQRIITAVLALGVLLPAFWLLPTLFSTLLLAAFVLAAAWEWAGFIPGAGRNRRLAYVALVALLIAPGLLWPGKAAFVLAAAGMLWWFSAILLIVRFPLRFGALMVLAGGMLVMVPAAYSMAALLFVPDQGRSLLLLMLAIVWAADVGAFFAGRSFGRAKLAPHVSPGKTWEGVIGGLASAALVTGVGAGLLGFSPVRALPLGLSVAMISVVGDLTVSMFKRNASLKDSGNLFPGHGGVLDRLDSITAAAPLFLLLARPLGWLGG